MRESDNTQLESMHQCSQGKLAQKYHLKKFKMYQ
jgi:hypothetical protein